MVVFRDEVIQLTTIEKRLYFFGAIVLLGLFLFTIIFGGLFSPLLLLQLRLFFVGIGLVYYLAIYFYNQRDLKVKLETLEEKHREIIICFNGKELGRR